MLAKKNRKRILLAISVLLLCFLAVGLAGCESTEQPLPEEYQGYFRYGSAGCVRLGGVYCSACSLYVNNVMLDGNSYSGTVSMQPHSFTYYSDGSFELTAEVKTTSGSRTGKVTFTGKISATVIKQLNIDQVAGSLVYTTTACTNPIHNHE